MSEENNQIEFLKGAVQACEKINADLIDAIDQHRTINTILLYACELALAYIEDGAPNTAAERLREAIKKAREEKQ